MTDGELSAWITALDCQREVAENMLEEAREEKIRRYGEKYADKFQALFFDDLNRLNNLTIRK